MMRGHSSSSSVSGVLGRDGGHWIGKRKRRSFIWTCMYVCAIVCLEEGVYDIYV